MIWWDSSCFICSPFPESTSHVKVSCICHFHSHIMESEQIEHSSWGNVNITSRNQLLSFSFRNVCTSDWQAHQFSPDGPEPVDLWFKNETQPSDLSPETTRVLKKKKKSWPALLFFFLFAFSLSLLSLFIKSSSSHGLRHVCGLFFDAGSWRKTFIWQCCVAYTALSLAELWITAWWWSKVKRATRLHLHTAVSLCRNNCTAAPQFLVMDCSNRSPGLSLWADHIFR